MRYPENHGELLKDGEEPQKPDSLVCPNCGSNQWYEGPSGGMSTNIKCANPDCGLWFNSTPFGLDFIGIKENVGEEKFIRWYCPECDDIRDFALEYGTYPHCPFCKTPLKVCWSHNIPQKICDACPERFKCYTTRGNF